VRFLKNKTAGSVCCQPFRFNPCGLPMSAAAVSTTAAVGAAATSTVEATASTIAMETTTAMDRAAAVAAACITASACASVATATGVPASAYVSASTYVPATAVVTMTPTAPTASAPAIPWASANEYAASKPAGSVEAIRRAGIGIVIVIAVIAHWRSAHIAWANPYSHTDLRLRVRQRQHQNAYQSQIFQVPHKIPLFRTAGATQTDSLCRPPGYSFSPWRLSI
jgi:hypothetical protein